MPDSEGGCVFCGKSWSLLQALGRGVVHVPTDETGRRSMFVLCESCWLTAALEERIVAHVWWIDTRWRRDIALLPHEEQSHINAAPEYVERAIRGGNVEVAVANGGVYTPRPVQGTEAHA